MVTQYLINIARCCINNSIVMDSNTREPTTKQIVEMFIKVREEIRAASSISNYESESTREYINHSCLRSEKCQGGGAFKFVKGSRFTNPFNHINSCIANGNRETLLELYHTERRNRRNGSQFLLSLNATDSERAKHSYLILIK